MAAFIFPIAKLWLIDKDVKCPYSNLISQYLIMVAHPFQLKCFRTKEPVLFFFHSYVLVFCKHLLETFRNQTWKCIRIQPLSSINIVDFNLDEIWMKSFIQTWKCIRIQPLSSITLKSSRRNRHKVINCESMY